MGFSDRKKKAILSGYISIDLKSILELCHFSYAAFRLDFFLHLNTPPITDTMPSENAQSVKVLDELFQKLTVSKEAADIKESANQLASFINGRIEDQDVPNK